MLYGHRGTFSDLTNVNGARNGDGDKLKSSKATRTKNGKSSLKITGQLSINKKSFSKDPAQERRSEKVPNVHLNQIESGSTEDGLRDIPLSKTTTGGSERTGMDHPG